MIDCTHIQSSEWNFYHHWSYVFLSGHVVIQNLTNTLNEQTRQLNLSNELLEERTRQFYISIGVLGAVAILLLIALIIVIIICCCCWCSCIPRKKVKGMYQVIHLWRFRLLLSFITTEKLQKIKKVLCLFDNSCTSCLVSCLYMHIIKIF